MVFIAFVRSVMIGREGLHRQVLIDMFEASGAENVRSYISTGNISFESEPRRAPEICELVEHDLGLLLGRPTEVFVRSYDELARLHEADPFAAAPFEDPRDRVVTFFRERVPAQLVVPIVSDRGDFAVFAADDRQVFSVTREVAGRTQAPGGVIERLAGERVTTRAWSTIERILSKLT